MFLLSLRIYYLFLSLFFIRALYVFAEQFSRKTAIINRDVSWASYLVKTYLGYPYIFYVATCLLGIHFCFAIFKNYFYWCFRVGIIICSLFVAVTMNGHSTNSILLPAFALSLLPNHFFQTQKGLMEAYRVALCGFLLPYFISGLWKLWSIFVELSSGQSPTHSLTLHIFEMYTEDRAVNRYLIDHPMLSFTLYLSAVSLQLGCVACLWKPRLVAFVGIVLILFHIGTVQMLGVNFDLNILVALSLMVSSGLQKNSYKSEPIVPNVAS